MNKHSHAAHTRARSLFRSTRTMSHVLSLVILAASVASVMSLGRSPGFRAGFLILTDPAPQPLPYSEDFSLLAHSSTAYPSGWQGWVLGGGSTASFRTTAATDSVNLLANSTSTTTSSGAHNYNGKLGFLATSSVDPALVLAVDTTGLTSINLSFDIMTIRNQKDATNTRINQVDLQYRICPAPPLECGGSFTSVSGSPAGIYENNTTNQTSPGTTNPQKLESKMFTLPSATEDQPNVQLRWVQRDASGGGSRPSFAIDNVTVTGSSACEAPTVATHPSDVAITYGDDAVFMAAADGETSVVWEVSSDGGSNWSSTGVTADTLSIVSPDVSQTGTLYRAVFTNDCESAPPATSNAAVLSVNPRSITSEVSVDDKIYDGTTDATFNCSLVGVLGADDVACGGGAATFPSDNAGIYNVTVAGLVLGGADAGNYSLEAASASDNAEILSRSITVTAVASSKVYDGTSSSDGMPLVTLGSLVAGDTGNFVQTFDTRNVGTSKILKPAGSVTDGNSGGNYSINFVPLLGGEISPRAVTVTAVADTKVLDGNTSSAGIPTVSPPLVAGDTPNFKQTFDSPLPGTGKTLTPSGTANDGNAGMNYSYNFVPVHTGAITAAFCFSGFHLPIGGSVENGNGGTFADPVRSFKLGSTIPIKFSLYEGACGGSPVTTGVHTLQLIKYADEVDSDPAIDATPTDAATTGNQFRLADGEWRYNLDTKRSSGLTAGTWLIRATLFDGSIKTVWVSIKK
jgi:hypothetical protein